MYALEPEPEQKGRWRRLGVGALIAGVFSIAFVVGADRFEPSRKLLARVVRLTVVAEPPKKEPLPPERPLPPPPKKSPPRAAKTSQPKPAATTPKPQSNEAEQVGLNDTSFGEGSGGPTFAAGNTQMGTPPTVYRPVVQKREPPPPAPVAVREARPLRQEPPPYTERARRLRIQGLMVLEVEIDALGRVTAARVRQGLEPGLDAAAVQFIRQTKFQPATQGGRPIASARFLRLRYQLEG